MKTKNPLMGLLLYFLYTAGIKLTIVLLQGVGWGIGFLFTGNAWVHMIFSFNIIAGAAFLLLTGMGNNKEINWERFQVSMPIRRRDLAISQYLSTSIASLLGIPIYVIVKGFSSLLHENVYFTFSALLISIAPFLATPFILTGFYFPLSCIKSIEDKQEGIFPLFMLASIAIPQLVVWGAYRLGWSVNVASLMTLAVSMAVFIASYLITKKLYAKIDF